MYINIPFLCVWVSLFCVLCEFQSPQLKKHELFPYVDAKFIFSYSASFFQAPF